MNAAKDGAGYALYTQTAANASVSGGVLNGQIDANAGTLSITGGKFTADISPYLGAGKYAAKGTCGFYSISSDTLTDNDAAARIGDSEYYATVAGALAAAKDDGTVTVLKGTTETAAVTCSGTNVTLDLNGKTVDMGSKKITVSGGLTIKDSSSQSNGTITGTAGQMLTVSSSLTLESGKIVTTGYGAVRTNSGATFTMTGGTVQGNPAVQGYKGTVNITGGSVLTNESGSLAIENDGAQITIGTKNATSHETPYIEGVDVGENTSVNLYSGTVTSVEGILSADAAMTCRFSSDITDALPAGMACVQEKGYWKVVALEEANAAAKIGDTLYASAATAAEALKDGETLTLLKDITGEGAGDDGLLEIEARNVIIDLNGHSVTNNADDGVGISVKNPNKSPLADCTATIKNDGAPAKIRAKVPVRFSSGNSMYKITGQLQGDITLITTDTSKNAQQIELSAGALLAYSEAAADALGNGGFKATNANGDQYIYATASEAIAADADSTAFLLNDYIGGTSLQLNGDTGTVDLGGHTYVYTNTIAAIVADESNTNLTVKNGTVISGENAVDGVHVGVPAESSSGQVIRNNVSLTLDNVKMTVSAGTFGIVTNGNSKSVSVTLKNGSILTAPGTIGIYFPVTSGTLTIENSSITAGTGVAVKGGTVNISGDSVIHATGAKVVPDEALGSGVNSTGDAVYLEGNYERATAINITGGTFTSDNGYAVQMLFAGDAEDKTISISGGSFSSDPSAYVTDEYIALVENGQYVVKEKSDDTEPATVVGGAPETTVSGVPNDQKEAVEEAVNGIQAGGLTTEANAEANTNTITVTEGTEKLKAESVTVSNDDTVTIVVQPYLQIEVTGYKTSEDTSAPNTMTLNITPMVRTVATTADLDNNGKIYLKTEGKNEKNAVIMEVGKKLDVSTPIALTIPLPDGFVSNTTDKVFVQHKGYEYTAKVTESGEESNKTYTATFTNPHGFSTFTISTKSQTVATVNGDNYTSFQDAVNAAQDGDTITIPSGASVPEGGLSATISGADSKSVKVENKTNASITVTINSEAKTIGNGGTADFTYTYTPTQGGSGSSGSTRYTVTAPADVANGSVKVSPTRASRGQTVTITVTPDEGYELASLAVYDADGDAVSLTDAGNGKYTFTMPRSKVTVEAAFSEIVEEPEALPFVDVPTGAYYYDAVAWAVENGVTGGTSATTFSPDNACTRAQMMTFLWRAAGSPEPKTTVNPFTDVSESAYYYEAVLWAVENGITSGTSATTFSPDATVTRGQTVTFLWRNAGSPAASGGSFADVAPDAYYAPAVAWAAREGITSGTSATTFSPDNACTRAQIMTFLWRDLA